MRGRAIRLSLWTVLLVIVPHANSSIYQALVQSPCPVGTDGPDCSIDHVPSCREADGFLTPPYYPTTCTCVKEWRRYAYSFHIGTNAFAGNAGIMGNGTACYNVAKDDPCLSDEGSVIKCAQARLSTDGTLEEDVPERMRLISASPHYCSGGDELQKGISAICGGHGFCAYSWDGTKVGAGDKAECRCWKDRYGPQCEIARGEGMVTSRGDGSKCLNDCAGNGECIRATCACDEGYGGIDCSSTLDPASGRVVNTHTGLHAGDMHMHPRFFVLELPARYTTHHVFYSRLRWHQDMARPDGWRFLERCLRSRRRTMDPTQ
eukprot:2821081-Pyramimonas_sp.AAC.1